MPSTTYGWLTYESSRNRFRKIILSTDLEMSMDVLNVPQPNQFNTDTCDDATIDIITLKGRNDSLLIHISGTHGVEGYVGAEIQHTVLTALNTSEKLYPTIMFVHGLNPYGMIHNRRVNEDNIDLNRNALFNETDRKAKISLCGNMSDDMYHHINHAINPQSYYHPILSWVTNLFNMLYIITSNGYCQSKRYMVTGTYCDKYKQGLFYGGEHLGTSHKMFSEYLISKNYTKNVKDLAIIDVHSGQGEFGKDTIMVSNSLKGDIATNTLKNIKKQSTITNMPDAISYTHQLVSDTMTNGYELTSGDVADNYPKLFDNLTNVFSVTQEFGTYNPLYVTLELIMENQVFHHSNNESYGDRLRHVFSPMENEKFVKMINERGKAFFINVIKNI